MQKGYVEMNRYIALQKAVELGSLTKAAEVLGYTQPAMSQMITSLERELSIKLLYRSRYGSRLTIEGERLFPSIQKTVAQYQAMQEIAKEIRGLDTGIIRIGTISSVSCPTGLPTPHQAVPGALPQCGVRPAPGGLHQYSRAGAHWGGGLRVCEYPRRTIPNIKTRFVKAGEHRAVLPLNHPLAQAPYVTLEDLVNEPFLLLEEGLLSEPLEAFHQQGLEPSVRLRVHDDYSILSMIEAGLGHRYSPARAGAAQDQLSGGYFAHKTGGHAQDRPGHEGQEHHAHRQQIFHRVFVPAHRPAALNREMC